MTPTGSLPAESIEPDVSERGRGSAEGEGTMEAAPASESLAIETVGLTRRFGRTTAVSDLSLRIPRGTLYGFVGPNGAGKTTTLRMIAGLLPPSSGQIRVLGEPVRANRYGAHHHIGYMPDFFGVYDDMRVWEYLDFFGRCHGVPPERRATLVDELLDLVDLSSKRDADVQTLSRGMQQRLCLAHALVHDPKVLLLDEPASGLDPRARIEIRELLRELRDIGKTIVISSHILADLAEICDAVGILEQGRLLVSGKVEDLERQLQPKQTVKIRVLGDVAPALACLAAMDGVEVYPIPARGSDGSAAEPAAPDSGPAGRVGPDAPEPDTADLERLAGEITTSDGTYPPTGPPSGVPASLGSTGAWVACEIDGGEAARADVIRRLVAAEIPVTAVVPVERDLEGLFMRLTTGAVA